MSGLEQLVLKSKASSQLQPRRVLLLLVLATVIVAVIVFFFTRSNFDDGRLYKSDEYYMRVFTRNNYRYMYLHDNREYLENLPIILNDPWASVTEMADPKYKGMFYLTSPLTRNDFVSIFNRSGSITIAPSPDKDKAELTATITNAEIYNTEPAGYITRIFKLV